MDVKNILAKLKRNLWIPETRLASAIIIILLFAIFVYPKGSFVHAQFPQAIIDVIIFGVLIVIFNRMRERRLDIKRWQEEITDYREWKEPEATHRIVGNVRRLNREGISDIILFKCFLMNANLSEANLKGAGLGEANLQAARLEDINLQGAELRETNLQEAKLLRANLQEAKLYEANLQGARLSWAKLQKADFYHANLKGADLEGADLREAKLAFYQLSEVKTLFQAKLDPNFDKEARKKYPHLFKNPHLLKKPK